MEKKTANTTIRNGKLFCLNCGGEHTIIFPIKPDDFSLMCKRFNKLHKNCKPTWKEPEISQEKSLYERMNFWLQNGERGISSETIFQTLSGHTIRTDNGCHPLDPSDFGRCHNLLKTIPEWISGLQRLKSLSTEWENLVNNWDILTKMYEQKDQKMYDFMQTLITIKKQ